MVLLINEFFNLLGGHLILVSIISIYWKALQTEPKAH